MLFVAALCCGLFFTAAWGDVRYVDLVPDHFVQGTSYYSDIDHLMHTYSQTDSLDLDGDGVVDAYVTDDGAYNAGHAGFHDAYGGAAGNGAVVVLPLGAKFNYHVSPLGDGQLIGDDSQWHTGDLPVLNEDYYDWPNVWYPATPAKYMGLRFSIAGETHYGWVHLAVNGGVTVFDYAYETSPDWPIRAGSLVSEVPEPATVGLVGVGIIALLAQRRRRAG